MAETPYLIVTVSGSMNTGKTTIAMLITKALFDAGIDVGLTDYPENKFDDENQSKRIEWLKKRKLFVSVETNQIPRL